jgi:hypothetical protein
MLYRQLTGYDFKTYETVVETTIGRISNGKFDFYVCPK